ncbi:MAG TPA: VOC family protein [Spirochaetota bacterium]|nr:VOC family protein [Spirochaetota bacterium]
MIIEHVALWAHDLEKSREFYCTYFGGEAGEKYVNESKEFESYFIRFETGARLEIMHMRGKTGPGDTEERYIGYSHFAISVESKSLVDTLA